MPELPEVQTVVTQLGQKIVGKKITGAWSDWKKKIFPAFPAFVKHIRDTRVLGVRRLGKHIIIDLDGGYSIVAHLKMTGHLLIKDKKNRSADAFVKDPVNGYIHHILIFSDGTTLEFSDMRKFGWLRALKTEEVEVSPGIASLGIDALAPSLTEKRFRALLSQRKRQSIAVVLLEQEVIAGIGNIYRSEALFLAGILPHRPVQSLSEAEEGLLLRSVKTVLRRAVRVRGTSDGDFRDTDGLAGAFQDLLQVYGRTGKLCRRCGTMIRRQKIGQRSVFYCPNCQE